jgi:hypothetical protein
VGEAGHGGQEGPNRGKDGEEVTESRTERRKPKARERATTRSLSM